MCRKVLQNQRRWSFRALICYI